MIIPLPKNFTHATPPITSPFPRERRKQHEQIIKETNNQPASQPAKTPTDQPNPFCSSLYAATQKATEITVPQHFTPFTIGMQAGRQVGRPARYVDSSEQPNPPLNPSHLSAGPLRRGIHHSRQLLTRPLLRTHTTRASSSRSRRMCAALNTAPAIKGAALLGSRLLAAACRCRSCSCSCCRRGGSSLGTAEASNPAGSGRRSGGRRSGCEARGFGGVGVLGGGGDKIGGGSGAGAKACILGLFGLSGGGLLFLFSLKIGEDVVLDVSGGFLVFAADLGVGLSGSRLGRLGDGEEKTGLERRAGQGTGDGALETALALVEVFGGHLGELAELLLAAAESEVSFLLLKKRMSEK